MLSVYSYMNVADLLTGWLPARTHRKTVLSSLYAMPSADRHLGGSWLGVHLERSLCMQPGGKAPWWR